MRRAIVTGYGDVPININNRHIEAMEAINVAIEKLILTNPNGRDYDGSNSGYKEDRETFQVRLEALKSMVQGLEEDIVYSEITKAI